MRIQHNIMAMNAYRNYTNNVSAMQKNLEKLSSGYKINRAGDDAAGLAISEKMRAQITGLETAQKNAKDGISLVQTAEGALTEVHDMLNRMVELATQSANGTYDNTTDRKQMQKEVDQLLEEINRIADSSNFNGINLLDGSLGLNQDAVTGITYLDATDNVAAKALGTNVVSVGTVHGKKADLFQKPEVTINLQDVSFTAASSGATKAQITLNFGDIALTATATLSSGVANATAIAKAFADKFNAAAGDTIASTGSSGVSVNIGGAYYKVSGNKNALKLEFIGASDGSGAIATVTASKNTDKFTASMASAFNTKFDVGASISITASSSVGTVKNGNKIVHGTIQSAKAASETDIERWGADITLDAAKFMVEGNTLEIDGKVFTVALSSTANAHSMGVNGTVTISTKLASSASAQLKEFVRLMQGQTAGHFTVSAKADNKLHFDARASQDSNATVQAYTASKVKALVKAKDAGAAAKNAGVEFTVDVDQFTKNDVITVGGKSYVYKGTGTNAFSSVGGLESLLQADFGASKVTKTAAGDAFKFTVRAATASAAAPMIQGRGLTLQIGDTSDDFNQLNVGVQDMHAVNLGIRGLKIDNEVDAQAAIQKIKDAINTVSDVRGTLGATQNRLDHTINNLSVMTENIQDAESTIRDTDVAEEMMAYTKNNILIQSAQAMLAQANQVPQGVLQLLG